MLARRPPPTGWPLLFGRAPSYVAFPSCVEVLCSNVMDCALRLCPPGSSIMSGAHVRLSSEPHDQSLQLLLHSHNVRVSPHAEECLTLSQVEPTLSTSALMQLEEEGRLACNRIGVGLGLWLGTYQGLERQWLRYYDA